MKVDESVHFHLKNVEFIKVTISPWNKHHHHQVISKDVFPVRWVRLEAAVTIPGSRPICHNPGWRGKCGECGFGKIRPLFHDLLTPVGLVSEAPEADRFFFFLRYENMKKKSSVGGVARERMEMSHSDYGQLWMFCKSWASPVIESSWDI